jgi:polar amino acid transport system substrate-binding protein
MVPGNLKSLLVAVVAVLLLSFGVTHARTLNEILSAGEIRVGVNPNYPPATQYNDKNELVGFEVDVANKLAEMLGVKIAFVTVDPNSRIPFVTSNKIDFVMGGMTRTPDRAKLIDFTVPINTEAFAVLTTEGQPFNSVTEMNNDKVTFVEVRGTTPVPYIQQNLANAKLLLLDDWPDAFRALADGRATAIIADQAFFGDWLKKFGDVKWKILKGVFGPVYYDCLGVAQGNDSLRRWLNVALFNLQSQGFVDESWKRWYNLEMVVPVNPQPYF